MNALSPDIDTGETDGLAIWIEPARTALLVIDMQVDFASPSGLLGQAGLDMDIVKPALAAAQRLVGQARSAEVPVIFIGLQTRAELDSPTWKERMRRRGGSAEEESGICRAGEVGSEFYGPLPLEGELVVPKIRYSGFFGTNLDAALKAMGIDTLVACGLTTECCVDCTVRDAFHLDYHVFIASDACAAYEPDIHAAALKSLELNCAILVDTDQVLAAWQGH